jgi:hypothetical protein
MFDENTMCAYPDEYTQLLRFGHLLSACCVLNILALSIWRHCMKPLSAPKRKLSDPPQYLSIDVEQPSLDLNDFGPSRGDSPYGVYHRSYNL